MRQPISVPACGEACCVFPGVRVRRASSLPARFQERRRVPGKFDRRAARSPLMSGGSESRAIFATLARSFVSAWAYTSPFNRRAYSTIGGGPLLQNSFANDSKVSIHRIKEIEWPDRGIFVSGI